MSKYCNCILSNKVEISYRGNPEAQVVFVAESPGEEEERQKRMLVGASGKLLAQSLKEVGFDLSNIFLMNAARCRIDKNKLSSREINQVLEACRPKFVETLKKISPKLIVCLGEIAFKQVMNIKKGIAVSSIAGKEFYSDEFNCKVVATYHPAHILRNPHKRTFFLSNLKFAYSLLHTSANLRKALAWKEVDSIAPILQGNLPKNGKCYFTALDSETQGLKWYDPNSIIISYSIAKDLYEGWNVVLHEEVDNLDEADFCIEVIRDGKKQKIGIKKASNYEQKVEELKELLARKDIKKYFMNLKYEKHRFYNLGIRKFESCFDVKVMAHCLDPDAYKNSSLRELASVFLDNSFHLYKDLLKDEEKEDMLLTLKKNRSDFNKYACADAVITLQLGMVLRKLLAKDKKLSVYYSLLAQPVESEVLFEIERNGVLVDKNKIPALKKRIQLEMANVTDEFIKKCPKKVVEKHKDDFKLSKGIILREALFKWEDKNGKHELGFNLEPILVSRKTGEPIIDKKKVLLKILHGNYPDKVKDLVQTYLKWRELEKLLTNYIKNIEQQLTKENRLHPDVSITFTATGRTGMRKPALQTIPKRSETAKYIRELFVAPKGKVLLEVDYNISELRWIAHVANERTLKRFFQEGKDPHLETGLWINGIKDRDSLTKEKIKEIRQASKCFHPDVEVLTRKGWVKLRDYDGRDEIIQGRIVENGYGIKLEWTRPLYFEIRKNHCDTLVHLYNKSIDIEITPDHDLLGVTKDRYFKRYKPYELTKARYIYNSGVLFNSQPSYNEQFLRLAVATQADGSLVKGKQGNVVAIRFGFRKLRKVKRIRILLKGLDYKEFYKKGVYTYRINDKYVIKQIMQHLDEDKSFKWDLLHYSLKDRLIILDELGYWDSYMSAERYFVFTSTNKKNIDVIQAIASTCGFKSFVGQYPPQKPHHNTVWYLSIKDHSYSRGGNIAIEEYPYRDEVVTLVVPSHIVLVRYKGKTLITYQCCNFGLSYGMSPKGLQDYALTGFGVKFTEEESKKYWREFFKLYKNLPAWHKRTKEFARKYGYVRTVFGRIRKLPHIYSNNVFEREEAERQALNTVIQSPSSDGTLLGAYEILHDPRVKKEECKLVLFIHDALIFEIDEDKLEYYYKIIKEHMENLPTERFGFKLSVPLKIEGEYGYSLAEMKEIE